VREREESKRLLYVALTRARDRLYLGTTVKDGRVMPTRGSLAEVLPASLLERFAETGEAVQWPGSSGAVHRFRVCRTSPLPTESRVPAGESSYSSDFGPLPVATAAPISVASLIAREDSQVAPRAQQVAGDDSDRIVGTIVHRLLQRFGFGPDTVGIDAPTALAMLRADEMAATVSTRPLLDLAAAAVDAYTAVAARADVRTLYQTGEVMHEVRFTMMHDGRMVRGTIDCLVRGGDGRFTVLEFKTGRRRDAHNRQLDLYRRAVEQLFPGADVAAQLVYAAEAPA
jgi:ATP-dependent helicase/nuclease subunit A